MALIKIYPTLMIRLRGRQQGELSERHPRRFPYPILLRVQMLRGFIFIVTSSVRDLMCGAFSHDIYKWHADQRRHIGRPRASSFAGSVAQPNPAFEHIHEPGGFRRNYVLLQANEQGNGERRATNKFIDFLYIYGQFVSRFLTRHK